MVGSNGRIKYKVVSFFLTAVNECHVEAPLASPTEKRQLFLEDDEHVFSHGSAGLKLKCMNLSAVIGSAP